MQPKSIVRPAGLRNTKSVESLVKRSSDYYAIWLRAMDCAEAVQFPTTEVRNVGQGQHPEWRPKG